MKKFLALLLTICMLLPMATFVGCTKDNGDVLIPAESKQTEESMSETSNVAESVDTTEGISSESESELETDESESATDTETQADTEESVETTEKQVKGLTINVKWYIIFKAYR